MPSELELLRELEGLVKQVCDCDEDNGTPRTSMWGDVWAKVVTIPWEWFEKAEELLKQLEK